MATESPTDYGIPSSDKVPSHILIRPATLDDCDGMTECFYTSFWVSHPFWIHVWPPRIFKPWLYKAFEIGIAQDKSMRTFVAIDTRVTEPKARNAKDGRVAAFTRWRIPQPDGNRDEMWPEMPQDAAIDQIAMGAFFSGMVGNRAQLMAEKPHWCKSTFSIEYPF